jgi:hypothetical protein
MTIELTQKNNASSEFISIIDFKRRTVIFAGAPSPDVSFVSDGVLEQEQGSENQTISYKSRVPSFMINNPTQLRLQMQKQSSS